jgi:hypothetical protein
MLSFVSGQVWITFGGFFPDPYHEVVTKTEIHRIDKYYMLVRKYVNASFRLLIREEWASLALAEYTDILTGKGGPLKSVLRQVLELCPD